jgi:iron complex outermembrane recepter protein
LMTPPVAPGARSATLAGGAGSYGSREARASATLAGDEMGLSVYAQHQRADNYRDNNRYEQNNVVADLNLRRDATALTFSAGADGQKLRLPGNRTEAELATDRRGTRTPEDFSNIDGGFARVGASHAIGSHELAVDVGYRQKENRFQAVIFGLPLRGTTEVERWSITPRARFIFPALGMDHSLVVGTEFEWWDYRSVRNNPADASADQTLSAVYVQDSIELAPGTRLLIGGRHQRVEYRASDAASIGGALDASQTRSLGAYEFGVRQALSPSVDAFARFGRSFRFATVDEVYAPSLAAFFIPGSLGFLEPQSSHDSELGTEYRDGGTRLRVALFNSEIKNEIHFDPNAFANVNLPPTRRRGLELDLRQALTGKLDLSANYSYTDARFRSGSLGGASVENNRIPLVPRHRIGAGIGFEPDAVTRLSLAASYVGKQRYDGDEANTFPYEMPAYTVVDLMATRSVGRWRLSALVNNLFNEHYYSYALGFFGFPVPTPNVLAYPAAERSFLVSAEYRFGD